MSSKLKTCLFTTVALPTCITKGDFKIYWETVYAPPKCCPRVEFLMLLNNALKLVFEVSKVSKISNENLQEVLCSTDWNPTRKEVSMYYKLVSRVLRVSYLRMPKAYST